MSTGQASHPRTSDVTQYYALRSETYDGHDYHHRLVDRFLQHVPLKSGQRVLDIATGTGQLALRAGACVGAGGSVLGIDVTEAMLARARSKARDAGHHHVTFQQADAEGFDAPAKSFDAIFCLAALSYVEDVPRMLRRWHQLLTPGGTIAFDGEAASAFTTGVVIKDLARGYGVDLPYGEIAATPERCHALLAQAGCRETEVHTEQFGGFITLAEALGGISAVDHHPLCAPLRQLPAPALQQLRTDYLSRIHALVTDDGVWNDITIQICVGRSPGEPGAQGGNS